MRVSRKQLEFFLKLIKRDNQEKELTDSEFAECLARHIEANPGCIKPEDESFYSLHSPPQKNSLVWHSVHGKGQVISYEGENATVDFWMNENHDTVPIVELKHVPRFSYSCVGYGVFSLLGEKYRMGRVEIFDGLSDSGYAVDEGSYCLPFFQAQQFESFIEGMTSDLPINIEIGHIDQCRRAVSEELGIPIDKLNDTETKKEYYRMKNEQYAREVHGLSWDEFAKKIDEQLKNKAKK